MDTLLTVSGHIKAGKRIALVTTKTRAPGPIPICRRPPKLSFPASKYLYSERTPVVLTALPHAPSKKLSASGRRLRAATSLALISSGRIPASVW
jgi:hypothetical protein